MKPVQLREITVAQNLLWATFPSVNEAPFLDIVLYAILYIVKANL